MTDNQPADDLVQTAITVGELIQQLEKLPKSYSVHINVLGKVVCGITAATDIGGDYFGQVFLENFDHDPDTTNDLKAALASRPDNSLIDEKLRELESYADNDLDDAGSAFSDGQMLGIHYAVREIRQALSAKGVV